MERSASSRQVTELRAEAEQLRAAVKRLREQRSTEAADIAQSLSERTVEHQREVAELTASLHEAQERERAAEGRIRELDDRRASDLVTVATVEKRNEEVEREMASLQQDLDLLRRQRERDLEAFQGELMKRGSEHQRELDELLEQALEAEAQREAEAAEMLDLIARETHRPL
jgi:hypothetical protein